MTYLLYLFASSTQPCSVSAPKILNFPHWYDYLPTMKDSSGTCVSTLQGINDIWLIVAAIIEILLRVAAIVAVAFVIYSGIQYATSQGSPEKTGQAKNTLVNAVIGLAIAIMASAIISFIARDLA